MNREALEAANRAGLKVRDSTAGNLALELDERSRMIILAAIEAYHAALPDEDGLVKEARRDGTTLAWKADLVDLVQRLADALEAPRAKPDKQVAALAEFFNRCTESAWDGCGIDGSDVQEWGMELRLLTKTQYDPEKHGPNSYDVEPGEDWYIFSDWLKAALAAAPETSDDR